MIYSLNMNGELGLSLPPLPPPSSSVAAEPAVAKRHGGDAVINPGRRDLWDPQQQQDADSSEHFPSLADRARASTRHVIKNGLASPTHSAHATFFRPTAGTSVNKVAPDRRAKKVQFYRNGDRFFAGLTYAVSRDRYRTLDSLMSDLTDSPLGDKAVLPKGVRHIFTLDGGVKITGIDQLVDGMCYVCASTPVYRKVDYPVGISCLPTWNAHQLNAVDQSQWDRALRAPDLTGVSGGALLEEDRDYIVPKLVTVIRNGSRPRKAVRILLNKKTAHSFDQVLCEITDAVKLDSGAVKKIFTITGQQIFTLQDFFKDETVFVAYGSERCSVDDFELSSNEIQFVSAYQRTGRQMQSIALKSPRSLRRRIQPPTAAAAAAAGQASPLSSPRRTPNDRGCHLSSPLHSSRPFSPQHKSPILSQRKTLTNGHHLAGKQDSRDGESIIAEPPELRVKYKIGKQIGHGNFAVVKDCTEKARKLPFALKVIEKGKVRGQEEAIENEVAILRRLKNRNIVQLIEEFYTPSATFLIMELVTGGDLFDAIAESSQYSEKDASGMIYNLGLALSYLHSINIVHRDVKPDNLLVQDLADGTKTLKLGDFGLATIADKPLYTVCGTPTYIAPEVLAEIGYGVKVDVWAAGVIAYILLCGYPPFASKTQDREELFDKILTGKFEFSSPFWDRISSSAKELISGLLSMDDTKRLSADEMLQHPWVADVDTATDSNIHASVSNHLAEFTKSSCKPSKKQPGVAVIATTALDKGSRYFDPRGQQQQQQLQCLPDAGEVF